MVQYINQRTLSLADLRVKVGLVEFKNPIFVASGTYGYGMEVSELADITVLGAIVTKSITRYPREGNPPPRIVETPSGMLNSIGLANIGVHPRGLLKHHLACSTRLDWQILAWRRISKK